MSEDEEHLHPTSVWGSASAPAGPDAPPPPGDAAVLAHSFVPGLLAVLLSAAGTAHKRLQEDLLLRERDAAAQIPPYPVNKQAHAVGSGYILVI